MNVYLCHLPKSPEVGVPKAKFPSEAACSTIPSEDSTELDVMRYIKSFTPQDPPLAFTMIFTIPL